MLLKYPKTSFLKHLEIVEKGIPVKAVIPVTANIYLEKDKGLLTFMANNLEIGIKSTMDISENMTTEQAVEKKDVENNLIDVHITAENEEEAEKYLLPVKFVEIIKHLPEKRDISVNIHKETKMVEIKSGDAHFKLKGINADDYPLVKEKAPDKKPLILKEKELKEIIKHTVFSTSTDEGRPAFTGVLFLFENEKLNIIASDTYRMVVEERESHTWDYDINKFLVPAKSLRELQKILKDDEGEVMIYPLDNQLVFSFSHVYFVTRLLQDNYPDFRRVLPSSFLTKIVVDKDILEDIVGRASLVCDSESNAIRVKVSDDMVKVKASSEQGNMEDELKAVVKEGEDIDILMNVKFLGDVLKVLNSDTIIIEFSGKEAPCVIRPSTESGFLYLVLPIKVEKPL